MAHSHHDHSHEHVRRLSSLNRAFIAGILLNSVFVAAEFTAGILSNSMGLLSDAGHNLSDVASLLLALLAFRLAQVRPTSRYTYGYRRSTILVSLLNAVILLVEPIANVGPQEQELVEKIKAAGVPAILVINKIDTIKKEELLAVIATYAAVHEFDAVVPISARTGEGVEELLTEIDKYAIEGPQLFPEDMVSDQPERQLVAEIIREKMLRLLDREVPHGVAVGIERWNEREDGLVEINAVIYCEKASHKGIIIGKRGAMLKEIGQQARADIERMLDAKVFLELWVKVKEGWRNNQYQMRNFGYEDQ